ncbi:MAG: sigma-70 family RNA polymerase sigma factor [Planctomycetaceae bacterium]|nr:sigma-70 family RNA polymerase sigma factor [Planctomycetaceae bacterium]
MTSHENNFEEYDDLLDRARQGDELARSGLLQHLRVSLRPVIEKALGPKLRVRADGSDLIQKVLTQVVADWPQFRGRTGGEFLEWVRRILEHDIQELLQREKYAAKRSIDREEDASHEIYQAPGRQTSPSRRLILKEHNQIVRDAIDQLSEECQEVMRLKHLDDLTMAEIARQLDKSESAITRQLVKGMKELKALLKQRGITDA